jgi:hypothetical protein
MNTPHGDFLMRVSQRVALPPSVVQSVLNVAIDEMGWPEINAFNEERSKGQSIYEDAGGFCLRFIGRLFGAKPRDEVLSYRDAMKAMVAQAIKGADQ